MIKTSPAIIDIVIQLNPSLPSSLPPFLPSSPISLFTSLLPPSLPSSLPLSLTFPYPPQMRVLHNDFSRYNVNDDDIDDLGMLVIIRTCTVNPRLSETLWLQPIAQVL